MGSCWPGWKWATALSRSAWQAGGATIISESDDKFWGGCIYEAKDIEGHYWDFSERGSELDSTEWKLPPGIKMGA